MAELVDETGTTVFKGSITNGGSQTGIYTSAEFLFTETAGAGTYVATLDVAEGTVVVDVICYPLGAPWDADTAELVMADDLAGNNFSYFGTDTFGGVPLDLVGALVDVYDVAGSVQGGTLQNLNPAGIYPMYGIDGTLKMIGIRYPDDATITMTVTTTGAGGTTGRLLVKVIYFAPITPENAVKS